MRLLYLVYGPQSGVIQYLTNAFLKQDVRCAVFDARGTLNYRTKKYKVPSLRLSNIVNTSLSMTQFGNSWKAGYFRTDYAFKRMTRMADRYIKKNGDKFDLILQSGVFFSGGVEKPSKPYFLYLDNTTAIHEDPRYQKGLAASAVSSEHWKSMERATYEMADRIFTMSRLVESSLIQDYGISASKIRVVGAGPNLDRLPKVGAKSYDNKTLLFVGKKFSPKGGEFLKLAFQQVRQEIPDARLVIVGPREVIHGPGIIYKGFREFSEMPQIYAEASLFVLPTLQEAFGLAFLEAMAHQLPCVGTNIQAIPEIIDDGVTGFLVPHSDHDELAKKIILLLKDPQMMERMGRRGAEKVRQYYTWDFVATKIIHEFSKLQRGSG